MCGFDKENNQGDQWTPDKERTASDGVETCGNRHLLNHWTGFLTIFACDSAHVSTEKHTWLWSSSLWCCVEAHASANACAQRALKKWKKSMSTNVTTTCLHCALRLGRKSKSWWHCIKRNWWWKRDSRNQRFSGKTHPVKWEAPKHSQEEKRHSKQRHKMTPWCMDWWKINKSMWQLHWLSNYTIRGSQITLSTIHKSHCLWITNQTFRGSQITLFVAHKSHFSWLTNHTFCDSQDTLFVDHISHWLWITNHAIYLHKEICVVFWICLVTLVVPFSCHFDHCWGGRDTC